MLRMPLTAFWESLNTTVERSPRTGPPMPGAIHAVSGTRRSVPASEAVERPTALVALPLHGRSPLHGLLATSAFAQGHLQPLARAGVRPLPLPGQEATTS